MKTVTILAFMLIGLSMAAQDNNFTFAIGTDIKNALVGSNPTDNQRAADLTFEAHAVSDNFDYGLGYENFSRINFNRKFVSFGYHIAAGYIKGTDMKFTIQPSLEFSWIDRNTDRTFFTPSLNVNWNLDINKYFAVQLASNWLPRPDVKALYNQKHSKYVLSEGVKIVIKLPYN